MMENLYDAYDPLRVRSSTWPCPESGMISGMINPEIQELPTAMEPIQTTVKMEMVEPQSILEVENSSPPDYYQREEGEKRFKPNDGGRDGSGNGSNTKKPRNPWGEKSYADLITQAILSSPDKRLTLAEIYKWMTDNIPYFRERADSNSTAGWKVSKISGVKLSLDCSNFAVTGDNCARELTYFFSLHGGLMLYVRGYLFDV